MSFRLINYYYRRMIKKQIGVGSDACGIKEIRCTAMGVPINKFCQFILFENIQFFLIYSYVKSV